MINVFKGNLILKGITFGFLSLFVLESGTIAVLAGFYNFRIWNYDDVTYYSILVFNAVIALVLGTSIAKKLNTIQKITYTLNFVIFLMILAGYAYVLWYRFSHGV